MSIILAICHLWNLFFPHLKNRTFLFIFLHCIHFPNSILFVICVQVGGDEDGSNSRKIIINGKMDFHSDQTCNLMCNCPLMTMMMMMMNHDTTPYCTRVPPKTLELFRLPPPPLNSKAMICPTTLILSPMSSTTNLLVVLI